MFARPAFFISIFQAALLLRSVEARIWLLERDGRAIFARRFGQEQPTVLKELAAACGGGICDALADEAIAPLLIAQPECLQQEMADKIIDASRKFDPATQAKMIAAAVKYRQAEKNTPPDFDTNPPTLRNSVYCQKAPKNNELNGLVQAQDPANDPNSFFDPTTGATVTRGSQPNTLPFGTNGTDDFDNISDMTADFTKVLVSGNQFRIVSRDMSHGPNGTTDGDQSDEDDKKHKPHKHRANMGGSNKDWHVVNGGMDSGNRTHGGDPKNGGNTNNSTSTPHPNGGDNGPTNGTQPDGGGDTNNSTYTPPPPNGGDNGPTNNTTSSNGTIRYSALYGGNFGDFGSCSVPEIQFAAGFDGRRETSFEPVDKVSYNHGSAQNIDIITQFMCDQLVNTCKADSTALNTCAQAKIAADNAPAKSGKQADAFNAVFGIATDFASVTPLDNQGNPITTPSRR